MLTTTLHFIKQGDADEILRIYKRNNDCFKCVFQPADINSTFTFVVDRKMLTDYLLGTIRAVSEDDVAPYEEVQVSTMVHPRILFHVSDLAREEVSDRLWDIITFSWIPITKNELSNTTQTRRNAHSERVPSSQTGRYFSRPNPEDSDS